MVRFRCLLKVGKLFFFLIFYFNLFFSILERLYTDIMAVLLVPVGLFPTCWKRELDELVLQVSVYGGPLPPRGECPSREELPSKGRDSGHLCSGRLVMCPYSPGVGWASTQLPEGAFQETQRPRPKGTQSISSFFI